MNDIATFLNAQFDEREAIALAAQGTTRGIWKQVDPDREPGRIEDDYGDVVTYDESSPDEAQGRHIAASSPASVLAEVTAKRKIVAECDRILNERRPDGSYANHPTARHLARHTLWNLAAPFAEHPDYGKVQYT